MKNKILYNFILIILLICLGKQNILAQKVYTVDDVPNVHLYDANNYVSDPANKLNVSFFNKLNKKMRFLEDSLGVQCAIIVLPEIHQAANEFAHDLLNKWGVGSKETDRGLVFLLVYGNGEDSKRDIYMATGYGLEGDLPDAICKNIQTEVMLPFFKEKKFGEGLLAGVNKTIYFLHNKDAVASFLQQQKEKNTKSFGQELEEFKDFYFGGYYFVIGIVGLLLLLSFGYSRCSMLRKVPNAYHGYLKNKKLMRHNWFTGFIGLIFTLPFFIILAIPYFIIMIYFKRKYARLTCEKCGSHRVKCADKKMVAKDYKKDISIYNFLCKKCGHIHKEEVEISIHDYAISSSGKSSTLGGGHGSGGGGSWGGGASGGGGAGTSF